MFLGRTKDPFDGFFTQLVFFFASDCVPDIIALFQIIRPHMPGDNFCMIFAPGTFFQVWTVLTDFRITFVFPVPLLDYYVNLMDKSITATVSGDKKIARRSLPKIDLMLDWGVVKEGDIIIAKGTNNEAELLVNGNVVVNGEEMSMQTWLKEIYGWSSVQTYAFAVHKDTGKTLSQIRDEYLEQKEREY